MQYYDYEYHDWNMTYFCAMQVGFNYVHLHVFRLVSLEDDFMIRGINVFYISLTRQGANGIVEEWGDVILIMINSI